MPERFEKQMAFLRANPDYVAVGSAVLVIDPEGRPLRRTVWPTTHEACDKALLQGDNVGGLPHPAAMIRASAIRQVSAYREKFTVTQDKDLWLRLSEIGRITNLPEVLVQYRTHELATGSTKAAGQRAAFEEAIRDALARRGIAVPPRNVGGTLPSRWLQFTEPHCAMGDGRDRRLLFRVGPASCVSKPNEPSALTPRMAAYRAGFGRPNRSESSRKETMRLVE